MSKKVAIIIGAGPAGLTAAYQLLKKTDIKPIVLEASATIGGISQTVSYKGNHIDIGGHRFFTKDPKVAALWTEIFPLQGAPSIDDLMLERQKSWSEDGPNPESDEEVMLVRNRVSRILYKQKFFSYPVTLSKETIKNMGFLTTLRAGFGYLFSAIFKKKETSLENFYINRFGRPLYSMFFEKYTEKLWGRHPSEIDASWGAQRVKGLSLWKTLTHALTKPFKKKKKKIETSLIEEFYYPKRGPGQLYTAMARKIVEQGGEVILNAPVTQVELENNRVNQVKVTIDGQEKSYQGDYFFSSMPLKDLYRALGKKEDYRDAYEVATNLVYRDFITVGLLVKKLKLKNETKTATVNNIIPDTWIYIQEPDVKLGRLQIFNNWSPYMVKEFPDHIWIGMEYFVTEGDEMWQMSDQAFIEFAIDELSKIKVIDKTDVVDAVRIKIKKAYPAYFTPYEKIDLVKEHLLTIENLHCIGRNGQHRYNNMDHSMLTAMVAVDHLLDPRATSKEAVWQVNTEQVYHEEKKT
ncbi:MAG: NAD(P)/FAD-dependent oxidoreductase [Bacilli bacterium]|jgi:protoporphyrinogen oxidase